MSQHPTGIDQQAGFTIEERRAGIRALVGISGDLDFSAAPELSDAVDRQLEARAHEIWIDLRGLDFMDSTGLRTLVSANQRARTQGRRLAIVRGPEQVDRIFSVTRLDERFEIVADAGALASA
jgi:anti-anti-sigma factor